MNSGNYSSGPNRNSRSQDRYYDQYYGDEGYYGSSYRGNYRGRGRGNYRGRGNDYYNSRNYSSGHGGYYGGRGGGYSGYRGRDDYREEEYEVNGTRTEEQIRTAEELRDRSPESSTGSYDSSYSAYNGGYRGNYRGRGGSAPRGRGSYSHNTYGKQYHEEKRGRELPPSSRSSVSSSHKEAKTPAKSFKNPWISILKINDSATQQKLESKYVELEKLDKDLIELQRSRLMLEIAVDNLEASAEREKIHVQITNEKLEEFTYL